LTFVSCLKFYSLLAQFLVHVHCIRSRFDIEVGNQQMFARASTERLFSLLGRLATRIRTVALPPGLGPINSQRQILIWLLVTEGFSLVWTLGFIEAVVHGFGTAGPWTSVMGPIVEGGFAALLEESLRGLSLWALGNGGIFAYTALWVAAHQFYAIAPTLWRLPSDILSGIFYLKLWRGRWWFLAFIFHIGYNTVYILMLQAIRQWL
jgi:hypothetical protein